MTCVCRRSWRFDKLAEAPVLYAPQWHFSVLPPDGAKDYIRPLEVSFDNPLLLRFDQSAGKTSWVLKSDNQTIDKLHIELGGANLDSPLVSWRIAGVPGGYEVKDPKPSLTPGKAVFDVDPPASKDLATVRVSAARAGGTPLLDTIDLKLPDLPKAPAGGGGGTNPGGPAAPKAGGQ